MDLETTVFQAASGGDIVILACTVLNLTDLYPCDGRTDG